MDWFSPFGQAGRARLHRRCLPSVVTTLFLVASGIVDPTLATEPAESKTLRVGIFENRPIVFTDPRGQPAGIAIDTLKAIAGREGWRLRYIPGTWAEQLKRLERQDIDLLVGIAYNDARAQRFDFTRESLVGNWGVLYKRPELDIHSPLDLQGRRVAMLRDSIHTTELEKLLKSFNVKFKPVYRSSYEEVLASVRAGDADAGAVNRIFGIVYADNYALSPTGVVFNPIYIHYASPKGAMPDVLTSIDRELAALKRDSTSVYYQSLERWLSHSGHSVPPWLRWIGVLGTAMLLLVLAGAWRLRYQVRFKTKELREKSLALAVETDERLRAEAQLKELAHVDLLTGLPNRAAFAERFEDAKQDADRQRNKIAIFLLDIDRFKNINDSLGHATGDLLLQAVARRLHACLRGADIMYRFGGDEFVLTVGYKNIHEVRMVERRLLNSLAGSITLGSHNVFVSVSIGIALYPDHATSIEDLLRDADAAMYAAKERGRNQGQIYDSSLTQLAVERFTTETRLRAALERGELVLHYQPIVDLSGDRVIGIEALVRWHDPMRGLMLPKSFVPSAEENGMIVSIGKWVVTQACRDARRFEQQGLGELRLSVNVSSRQFGHGELFNDVRDALQASGFPPDRLELEITEHVFLALTDEVRSTLAALTSLGVRFAIDDFGTGYSSLGFLKQLPFDNLKIDRSFVAGIPRATDDMQIATTIINMARDLGMTVVAEGIETREQYRFLRARGCPQGQGHYFSPALPFDQLETWLRDRNRPRAVNANPSL